MRKSQWGRTFLTSLRRSRKFFPSIILYSLIFLVASFLVLSNMENLYFTKATSMKTNIAVHFDDDSNMSTLGLGFVQSMDSVQENATITRVSSRDSGLRLLDSGEVICFIDIPEGFVESLLYGGNAKVDIIFPGNNTLDEYIINDLLLNISDALSTAQASLFTMHELNEVCGLDADQAANLEGGLDRFNLSYYMGRKDQFKEVAFDSLTHYSIYQQMTSAYLVMILLLLIFILKFYYMGNHPEFLAQQKMHGLSLGKVYLAEVLASSFMIYTSAFMILLGYVATGLGISLWSFVAVIPFVFMIAMLHAAFSYLVKSNYAGIFGAFIIILILLYLAGGLVPLSFLPRYVQNIAKFNPLYYLIDGLMHVMF